MVLKTKSIRAQTTDNDGLRICVMRSYNQEKHPEYFSANQHEIDLSPSTQLLNDYHNGLAWQDYVKRFTNETLNTQTEKIKGLAKKALNENITLLCYEETPDNCHRRLLALACQMYEPNLKLILE